VGYAAVCFGDMTTHVPRDECWAVSGWVGIMYPIMCPIMVLPNSGGMILSKRGVTFGDRIGLPTSGPS